jgi:surface antigen
MLLSRKFFGTMRVAIALFAGLAVVAGIVVVAPAAYAGTDDYPAKWKNAARDSMFDSWGEYNRECTSWVAWRLHGHNQFEMPFHANAGDWGAKAKALGYTVNMTPAIGSVAWWNTSSRGHVAWVEAVNSNKTVKIEEYNIGGSGKYDEATIPTSSVSGYIHFQDLATSFADGAYITYAGDVYRMAGGAPIYVSSWGAFGKTPAGLVSAKQWAALPRIPRDGTFITGATSKRVYRIVGGAPIYIGNWNSVGGIQPTVVVPDATIANAVKVQPATPNHYDHLNYYPTGTNEFVLASPSKKIYQITGKAAVPLTSWAAVGGKALPTVSIGDDAIANAGAASTSPYTHLLGYAGMPTPLITGTVKLLHPLTASLGTWNGTGFKITYSWYRNGVLLPTVTGKTYTPHTTAAIGTKVTVKVTATRTNFVSQTVTSAATVPIPK